MEAVATAVAKLCFSSAGSAVRGEVAHLRSMRTEVEHIRRELELTQDFLKGRSDTKHTCVKQVRDLAGDFEVRPRVRQAWSCLPGPLVRSHHISTRIRELNERNVHLRHHVQLLTQQQLPPYYHVPSATELSFQELEIIGRSRESAELKRLIFGGDAAAMGVVSVWGMGGIGKSSLVRNEPELLDAYDCGGWLTMPHHLDNTDEFMHLLRKQLGLGTAAAHDDNGDLQEHLKDKRYMIVVDDLLTKEQWDQCRSEILEPYDAYRTCSISTIPVHCCYLGFAY
ncbi:hypothetical protein ACQ4PT_038582 [Festuca glaucescens]